MNLGMTTILTYTDVSSIGTGLTVDDMVFIPISVRLGTKIKNILY